MTTTAELKLCKGLPYQIRVRARGEYDEVLDNQVFNADSSVSVNMTTYDGFAETYEAGDATAGIVDFTGTVLPYKFEYSDTLQTVRYCLMPQGQTYQNVVGETTQTSETLAGCLKNVEDDGSAQTLSAWAISNQYVVLCPEAFKYMTQQSIGYILGSNANYIGDVSVPQHTVYTYDNGTWTEYTPPSYTRNFTVTGTPSINDNTCMVSGFTGNDYIVSDESFAPVAGDTWEFSTRFVVGSMDFEGYTTQTVCESNGLQVQIKPDFDNYGHLHFVTSDGNNSDSFDNIIDVSEGDEVFFDIEYDGTNYNVIANNFTSGEAISTSYPATLTAPIVGSVMAFGVLYFHHLYPFIGAYQFNGSINMLQTSFYRTNTEQGTYWTWDGYSE